MSSKARHIWRSCRGSVVGRASRLDLGLAVVILLPVLAVVPLLQPGLPRTADGYLHLLRVVEIDASWRDGVYYPRWAPDMAFGYGYPIFNYFAPLLYLITGVVHLTGVGFDVSLKAILVGCVLLGGGGMYAFVKDVLGARAGILAAACYVYAPYMLRDNFLSGVYAEFLALSIMPAALWSFNRLLTNDNPVYLATTPVLCGAVVISHNISGMLFIPLLVLLGVWSLCCSPNWRTVRRMLWALVLSLALVAVFLLPALAERPSVKLDRLTEDYFDFRLHFLTLREIFSPSRPLDHSSLNPVWGLNLGAAQVVLAVTGLLAALIGGLDRRQKALVLFFLVVLVSSLFMTLPMSTALWEHVPLLAFAEFPWRFLGIAVLAGSFLAGATVHLWSGARWRHSGLALLAVTLAFVVAAEFVDLYQQWPAVSRGHLSARDVVVNELRTGVIGTTSAGECLPTWVVEEPSGSPLVSQYLSFGSISKLDADSLPDSARAEQIWHTVVSDGYRVVSDEAFTVQFNTFYFPGWQAFVDSELAPIEPSYPKGLITFHVPAGEHTLAVRFGDTPVRVLGKLISTGALVPMLGGTVFLALRRRKRERLALEQVNAGTLNLVEGGVLALTILILVLLKEGVIDPHTTWFRKASPPEQVLGVQHAAHVNLNDEVLFLGYDTSRNSVAPGDALYVRMYWEAQRRLRENYSVFLHLDDLRPEYISWSLSESINPGDIPTSAWTPGFYVSDPHRLSISSETPPGLYVLRAGLYDPESGERLSVLDEESEVVSDLVELGRVRVRRTTPVDLSDVTMVGPFTYGEEIRLLGYKLAQTSVTPGNYFRLYLYWEALTEMTGDYSVFVHLVEDSDQIWAQADGVPVSGMYPTWAWLEGERVEDEHLIPLESAVPPGEYRLAVGVYELDTLLRLEITDQEGTIVGDQILLPVTVEVRSP